MKKAVGHLIPYMEKEKEESTKLMKEAGTWNENVFEYCLFLSNLLPNRTDNIVLKSTKAY